MGVQEMSHRQRRLTPCRLCLELVGRVMEAHQSERVAVLWTCPRSEYARLWPLVDCWPLRRDANLYAGPWPVVCHPPCGPWGKLSWSSRESKSHGIWAMELVHRWGGIVEQPLGSQLFKLHGDGRAVQRILLSDFGFGAPKPTILYEVIRGN
jgi:hypothetical protein